MKFHHNNNEYKVDKCFLEPIYIFFVKRQNAEGYTRLFSTAIQGKVTTKTCIQELIDRAAQRQSALDNTFGLAPASYINREHQPSIISGGAQ